jgi:hypothetical protein
LERLPQIADSTWCCFAAPPCRRPAPAQAAAQGPALCAPPPLARWRAHRPCSDGLGVAQCQMGTPDCTRSPRRGSQPLASGSLQALRRSGWLGCSGRHRARGSCWRAFWCGMWGCALAMTGVVCCCCVLLRRAGFRNVADEQQTRQWGRDLSIILPVVARRVHRLNPFQQHGAMTGVGSGALAL